MIISPSRLVDEKIIITNGKGQPAQVGYDCTVSAISKMQDGINDLACLSLCGAVLKDRTSLPDYKTCKIGDIWPGGKDNGEQGWRLPPGVYSVTFEQGCNLPNGVSAFFRHRSSLLRCGATVTSGVYDPGFCVHQMGAVMVVHLNIMIEQGARIAQFVAVDSQHSSMYNGQWQGDKDVK